MSISPRRSRRAFAAALVAATCACAAGCTANRSRYFATTDSVTMWLENSLPDTEIGDEEMYQHVSFRVSSNGVTSPWTAWEDSPEQQFSK